MASANRLASETSPYLRQHAENPVHWFPWGEDAFAEARERDVPILVSVGYSACHWCHVMAHESFEDEATAAVMNDGFVNIKVDREERPDVDAIYMEAVQAMTGSGGWPMTVFVDHDGRPFFGGTYFPPQRRGGMPSFTELLHAVTETWTNRRADIDQQAAGLTETIRTTGSRLVADDTLPDRRAITRTAAAIGAQFDPEWGGFGSAPKFPHTMALDLLLRIHAIDGDEANLAMVDRSLDAMAAGGIYDHLGGGFARYSTDREWLVPHFEKMLYDQALLARVYLHAWQVTGRHDHRQVVEETIDYVLRELRHADGGFFSAEDADSEGVEGKFYVWSADELDEVCGDAAAAAREWYGVTPRGNWEGTNILHRPVFAALQRPPEVEEARRALFDRRSERIRPGLDDKVLTEWNGLMLATLADAAAALDRPDWLAAAVANGEFLLGSLRRDDGRWMRSWQGGHDGRPAGARHLAYAADHGAIIDAFVRLGEASGEGRWLVAARNTADALLDLFWDEGRGGVFTTGTDAERLVTRPKDLMDGATPSAQSLAAHGFLRLGALTGESRYLDAADATLRLLAGVAVEHPTSFAHLLGAVDLAVGGITEVVITGDRPDLVAAARTGYRPNVVIAWGERDDTSPLWAGRADDLAYVCRSFACRQPVSDPDDLIAELDAMAANT
ncbi:MAG: thioredoxin domain-containing protein [Acidimicrobiia bacterium]|nr:thioredoxin domain-containing protein [Acidimicrobiia bacterium]